MKQSEVFRTNAANCAELADTATERPTQLRYKRMEMSWPALVEEQDWLDGRIPATTS